ncbi:hypothetical protein HMPREF1544_10391 [Mucor circinelloides 1006PhL]|uniref:Uncharacterized protein n=1 Tax=Mucor circinelloides f. circinelloides (strain 1006PhL) TaxID=1220926 RepID=S2JSX4_MUCC1|nr:hypothetical protein HMPREF1544_10391 [Mucor circinelloides 1006PhL]
MKLRERKKRVSNDIKQEDTKAGTTITNKPFTRVNLLNTWIRDSIKQEDTKNDSSSPQQNEENAESHISVKASGGNPRFQVVGSSNVQGYLRGT